MDHEVLVYTRPDCHLCEVACEVLEAYGLRPQKVNIDSDSGLVERYGWVIPVVFIDGKERFRGRVDGYCSGVC
jgi:glutaredoxin